MRAQLAADMRAKRAEMDAAKKGASAAIKAATANFKRERQEERDAKEKERQVDNLYHACGRLMKESLSCQHAGRMMYGTLKACEVRLEARAKRPVQELFKDHVQESLETELRTLEESREELLVLHHCAESLHAECMRVKVLIVTVKSRENSTRRTHKAAMEASSSCPSLPSLNPQGGEGTAVRADEAPAFPELIKMSYVLVAKALEIVAACQEAVTRTQKCCGDATAAVTRSLDRRKIETMDLKRSLLQQQAATDADISNVELRITGLKAHRHPETPRARERAETQLREAEEMLVDLKLLKQRIDDDIRCKTTGFKIDLFCRNTTTIRSGGHCPLEEA